jgi:REP element-mobilizing transposase RayT
MRAHRLVPWLRSQALASVVARAVALSGKPSFRILQFSVQGNHLHLVVEASDRASLSRGIQGLSVRLARQLNRRLGRTGRIWGDRYHARSLRTPREVRNGLVYVLMNHKKHGGHDAIDSLSSARWFAGWSPHAAARAQQLPSLHDHPATAAPRTWLARIGWRRHGLLKPGDAPA